MDRKGVRPLLLAGAAGVALVALGLTVAVTQRGGEAPTTVVSTPAEEAARDPGAIACPPPTTDEYEKNVAGAAQDALAFGEKESRKSFTGVIICEPLGILTVFRLPGHQRLDTEMQTIARKYDVSLHLKDARFSLDEAEATAEEVKSRSPALADEEIKLLSVTRRPEGYVIVGVDRDEVKAREILRDFGNRIQVVRTSPGTPL